MKSSPSPPLQNPSVVAASPWLLASVSCSAPAPHSQEERGAAQAVPDGDPMPCEQFEVAFQALSQWLADRAVLPIESSVGGSIHAVYDLLLKCAFPPSSALRCTAALVLRGLRRLCPCAGLPLVVLMWCSSCGNLALPVSTFCTCMCVALGC